jgi:hypothetical protein
MTPTTEQVAAAIELLRRLEPADREEAARRVINAPTCPQGLFAASECDDPACPVHSEWNRDHHE